MASYVAPENLLTIFNPNEFNASDSTLSIATGDLRYLKLTGGNLTGAVSFTQGLSSSGVITNSAGTSFLPSYSFTGDLDLGLYRVSADNLGIACAGSLVSTFNSTGLTMNSLPIVLKAGSNSSPSIYMSTDTTTGIYRPTANEIGFTCSGTERFRIRTSEIVAKLPIAASDGTASSPSYYFENDRLKGMYNTGTHSLGFSTNSTLRFSIDQTNLTSTLAMLAPAGTVSLPSYSFSSDPDTGIYRVSANSLGISCGGVLTSTFDTTGLIMNNLPINCRGGTLSAPGILFASETTTGIYRSASNTMAFSCSSSKILEISASTITVLASAGTATTCALSFGNGVLGSTGIFSGFASSLSFAAGGVEGLRCISTTVQSYLPIELRSATVSAPSLIFSTSANTGIYSPATNAIGFSSSSTLKCTVDSVGLTMNSGKIQAVSANATQTTSITTAVTANAQVAVIKLFGNLSATTEYTFQLNNSFISGGSRLMCSVWQGTRDIGFNAIAIASLSVSGSAQITVSNFSAVASTTQVEIIVYIV